MNNLKIMDYIGNCYNDFISFQNNEKLSPRHQLGRNQNRELGLFSNYNTIYVFRSNTVEKSVDWTEIYELFLIFLKKIIPEIFLASREKSSDLFHTWIKKTHKLVYTTQLEYGKMNPKQKKLTLPRKI